MINTSKVLAFLMVKIIVTLTIIIAIRLESSDLCTGDNNDSDSYTGPSRPFLIRFEKAT